MGVLNSIVPKMFTYTLPKGSTIIGWRDVKKKDLVTYRNPDYAGQYMARTQVIDYTSKRFDIFWPALSKDTIVNSAIYSPGQGFPREYRSRQSICYWNGIYSREFYKNDKLINFYEIKPIDRKFAKGFKGKLQRAAMRLGTDANGCERPVLNRVSEFMLKMLKKVK